MARKRMFDSEIIGQDSFIDLPMEAKALYFLLGMEADDEGFVNYKRVLRLYGGMEDSIKILAMKGFIIPFKSGVVVITDWNINNYLDKNRVTKTIYQLEKKQLIFNQVTKKYEMLLNPLKSSVKHSLNKCLTSIEESSIEENRREENNVATKERPEYQTPVAPSTSEFMSKPEYQTPVAPEIDIELFSYLETNFGRTISPIEILKIQSYKDSLSTEIIKEGIDRACFNNAKNVGYVMGILNSWKSKGFTNIEECRQEFDKKSKKGIAMKHISSEPVWLEQKVKKQEASSSEKNEMKELLREFIK